MAFRDEVNGVGLVSHSIGGMSRIGSDRIRQVFGSHSPSSHLFEWRRPSIFAFSSDLKTPPDFLPRFIIFVANAIRVRRRVHCHCSGNWPCQVIFVNSPLIKSTGLESSPALHPYHRVWAIRKSWNWRQATHLSHLKGDNKMLDSNIKRRSNKSYCQKKKIRNICCLFCYRE